MHTPRSFSFVQGAWYYLGMETQRKKRRQRPRNPRFTLGQITKRDETMFHYASTYRYLTPLLMSRLVQSPYHPIRRRMSHFFDHGYFNQYTRQDEFLPWYWPDFYMTDKKAYDYLLALGHHPSDFVHTPPKKKEDSVGRERDLFRHNFQASRFLASVEIKLKELGIEIIHQPEILKGREIGLPCVINHKLDDGTTVNFTDKYKPDLLFAIPREGKDAAYFTVEIELTNPIAPTKDLRRPSPLKKLLALRDIHKKETYKKEWGIPNLRTIFIHGDGRAVVTDMNMACSIIPKSNAFLYTSIVMTEFGVIEDVLNRPYLQLGLPPISLI